MLSVHSIDLHCLFFLRYLTSLHCYNWTGTLPLHFQALSFTLKSMITEIHGIILTRNIRRYDRGVLIWFSFLNIGLLDWPRLLCSEVCCMLDSSTRIFCQPCFFHLHVWMRLEKICSIYVQSFPFFSLLAGPQSDQVLRSFCLLYRIETAF